MTNRGFLMSAETGFITPTRIMMTIYSELIWKETVRPDSTLTVPGHNSLRRVDLLYKRKWRIQTLQNKTDGTERTKLNNDFTQSLFLKDDWLYYSNKSDGGKIYKINTLGKGRTRIVNDEASYINVYGDIFSTAIKVTDSSCTEQVLTVVPKTSWMMIYPTI